MRAVGGAGAAGAATAGAGGAAERRSSRGRHGGGCGCNRSRGRCNGSRGLSRSGLARRRRAATGGWCGRRRGARSRRRSGHDRSRCGCRALVNGGRVQSDVVRLVGVLAEAVPRVVAGDHAALGNQGATDIDPVDLDVAQQTPVVVVVVASTTDQRDRGTDATDELGQAVRRLGISAFVGLGRVDAGDADPVAGGHANGVAIDDAMIVTMAAPTSTPGRSVSVAWTCPARTGAASSPRRLAAA